jgi:hypothetical protein
MRRTKLLVALLLIAAGVLTLGSAPAFAAPAPCPNGFIHFFVFPEDAATDRNGNGLVCYRILPNENGGNSNFSEGLVVIDDHLE